MLNDVVKELSTRSVPEKWHQQWLIVRNQVVETSNFPQKNRQLLAALRVEDLEQTIAGIHTWSGTTWNWRLVLVDSLNWMLLEKTSGKVCDVFVRNSQYMYLKWYIISVPMMLFNQIITCHRWSRRVLKLNMLNIWCQGTFWFWLCGKYWTFANYIWYSFQTTRSCACSTTRCSATALWKCDVKVVVH